MSGISLPPIKKEQPMITKANSAIIFPVPPIPVRSDLIRILSKKPATRITKDSRWIFPWFFFIQFPLSWCVFSLSYPFQKEKGVHKLLHETVFANFLFFRRERRLRCSAKRGMLFSMPQRLFNYKTVKNLSH